MKCLVLLALAVAAHAGLVPNCRLSSIPVQENLDEHKVSGVWFEQRFYFSSRVKAALSYEDFTLTIKPAKEGLYVTERERKDSKCLTQNSGLRKRLGNAKYVYEKVEIKRTGVNFWVSETDYHNYLIEFSCLEVSGDHCRLPEVVVYSRFQHGPSADKAVHRAKEIISHLCVDPHDTYDTKHNKVGCLDFYGYGPGYLQGYGPGYGYGYPAAGYGYGYGYYGKDGKHDPKKGQNYGYYGYPGYGYGYGAGGYGYGYGKNYGYGGYYGAGYGAGYGYDYGCYGYKDCKKYYEAQHHLLEARKTNLASETKKFDAETNVLGLQAEKLKLEIEHLKKKPAYYHPVPAHPVHGK